MSFSRPKGGQHTRHLFVGNCGPSVGVDGGTLQQIFCEYGTATVVIPEQQQNPRSAFVFVTYSNAEEASAALSALNDRPCAAAGGRYFNIKYADLKKEQEVVEQPVALSTEECSVEGLTLLKAFVSEEEAQALLDCTDQADWETLARRRVCHFGYKFEYQSRNVDPQKPTKPFPEALQPVLERLQHVPHMPQVDQCTVNEYSAGVGLSPHIDTHSAFSGAIASLSLAGSAVMEFRRDGKCQAVLLPPRSLLVMAGPARYCWHHYIPHRKADRVQGSLLPRAPCRMSFTFRQVRGYPCDCQWPEHCDSQQSSLPPTRMAMKTELQTPAHPSSPSVASQEVSPAIPSSSRPPTASAVTEQAQHNTQPGHNYDSTQQADIKVQAAADSSATTSQADVKDARQSDGGRNADEAGLQQLEQEFVHDVYNAIAPHFSATRFAIWPRVRQFIEGLAAGAVVADVGCGNGKYFMVRQDIAVLGSDRSSGLAQVAATRLAAGTAAAAGSSYKADVAVADGMRLPYATDCFDAVLSIAVLHHVTTPGRRIQMLTELLRILKPGGRALVTVWATHQEDMKKLAKWQPIDQPGLAQGSSHPEQANNRAVHGCSIAEGERLQQSHDRHVSSADSGSEAISSVQQSATDAVGTSQSDGQDPSVAVQQTAAGSKLSKHDQTALPSNDYFVPWHLPFHRAEAALQVLKAGQQGNDAAGSVRIDNTKNSVVFSRYYHVYEQFELDKLVQQVPGAEVVDTFYDKDNWCVVMGKAKTDY